MGVAYPIFRTVLNTWRYDGASYRLMQTLGTTFAVYNCSYSLWVAVFVCRIV